MDIARYPRRRIKRMDAKRNAAKKRRINDKMNKKNKGKQHDKIALTLFSRQSRDHQLTMIVYVDDLFVTCAEEVEIENFSSSGSRKSPSTANQCIHIWAWSSISERSRRSSLT
jgi:hypothetical protein